MEKVHFTEDQSTNLATLYGRALDSELPSPFLGDPTAREAVGKIDYDFGKFKMGPDEALSVAMRAKPFDDWTREFLAANPDATVLHLGAGMDSRIFRIDPAATVRWFDVDFPDVIALRERIYPSRPGYRTIASSVTDPAWLDEIPADRPTLIVAEGLLMYLDRADGEALLRRLAERFPRGEMVFDVMSTLAIKLQKLNPVVRRAGATLRWGLQDPHELEKLGLDLLTSWDVSHFAEPECLSYFSAKYRLQFKIATRIPAFRNFAHLLRYRY